MKCFFKIFSISFFSISLITNTNKLFLLGVASSSLKKNYTQNVTKMTQQQIEEFWLKLTNEEKISYFNAELKKEKIILNNKNFDICFFYHIPQVPILAHNKKTSEVYFFDIKKISDWKIRKFILTNNIKQIFQLSKTITILIERNIHKIYFFDIKQEAQTFVEKTNFNDENFNVTQYKNQKLTTLIYDKNNSNFYWFSAVESTKINQFKIKMVNFVLSNDLIIIIDKNTKKIYLFDINLFKEELQELKNFIKSFLYNNFHCYKFKFFLFNDEPTILIHDKKTKQIYFLNIDAVKEENNKLVILNTKVFDEIYQFQEVAILIEAENKEVYYLNVKNINESKNLILVEKKIKSFMKISETMAIFQEKETDWIFLLNTKNIKNKAKGLEQVIKASYIRMLEKNIIFLIQKNTNEIFFYNPMIKNNLENVKKIKKVKNIIWLKNHEIFLQSEIDEKIYLFINNQLKEINEVKNLHQNFLKPEKNYIVWLSNKIIIRDEKTDKIYLLDSSDLSKNLVDLSDKQFIKIINLSDKIAILVTKYSNSVYLFNEDNPNDKLIDLEIKSDNIGSFENGTAILPTQDSSQIYVLDINQPDKKRIAFESKKFNSIRYLSRKIALLIEAETNQVYLFDTRQLKKELIIFTNKKFIKINCLSKTMALLTEAKTNQIYLLNLTKINEQEIKNLNIEISSFHMLNHWAKQMQIIILIEKKTNKIYLLHLNEKNYEIVPLDGEIDDLRFFNSCCAILKTKNPEKVYQIDTSNINNIKLTDLKAWDRALNYFYSLKPPVTK